MPEPGKAERIPRLPVLTGPRGVAIRKGWR